MTTPNSFFVASSKEVGLADYPVPLIPALSGNPAAGSPLKAGTSGKADRLRAQPDTFLAAAEQPLNIVEL